MPKHQDLLSAIDAFVAAPKRIAGANGPCVWVAGYNRFESIAKFPLEVEGELVQGARLEIVGLPYA